MRARAQTGPARLLDSCQGREQRYRTSSHSHGLLRTHPARAARRRNVRATTPRGGPERPLSGTRSWLGSPVPRVHTGQCGCGRRGTTRADASRAVTLAPRSLADVRRREEGCTCIGSATTNPKLDGDRIRHESQRETHAPCAGRAPGRRTPNHRCQNYFESTATTHSQYAATERRRRRRKRRKKGC